MRKEKIKIPRDIKETVEKRIYKKIVLSVLLMILLAVFLLLFGETVFASFKSPGKEIIYVILFVAIPLSFGIPFSLIDRSWTGEITRVDVRNEIAVRGVVKNGAGIYTKYFADIEIKLDNGKIIDLTVYVGAVVSDRNFNTFKVGDRVLHIYGTKHIQVVHENESRPTVCVVCGTANPPGEKRCDSCGHTLNIINK